MVGETNMIVRQPLTAEGHSIQLGSGGGRGVLNERDPVY